MTIDSNSLSNLVFQGNLIKIFGIAAGAFCVFLGYKLFVRGGSDSGRVSGNISGFNFAIRNYGPGLLFVLVGGFIIFIVFSNGHTRREIIENNPTDPSTDIYST